MDTNEPTPWEDINPPMALAPRREQHATCLTRLSPASRTDFRNELTACLALVAPVGMTEEARREWLTVAWGTLRHLPADLLRIGCEAARKTCDHPAKIVPAIVAETQEILDRRREAARNTAVPDAPRLAPPDVCTPEQAAAILAEFGLKRNPLEPA